MVTRVRPRVTWRNCGLIFSVKMKGHAHLYWAACWVGGRWNDDLRVRAGCSAKTGMMDSAWYVNEINQDSMNRGHDQSSNRLLLSFFAPLPLTPVWGWIQRIYRIGYTQLQLQRGLMTSVAATSAASSHSILLRVLQLQFTRILLLNGTKNNCEIQDWYNPFRSKYIVVVIHGYSFSVRPSSVLDYFSLAFKPGFHYPTVGSWRPELMGDRFPLPVNTGRTARQLG